MQDLQINPTIWKLWLLEYNVGCHHMSLGHCHRQQPASVGVNKSCLCIILDQWLTS